MIIDETEQFVLNINFHAGRLHIALHSLHQLGDGEVDIKIHLDFRFLLLDDDGGL